MPTSEQTHAHAASSKVRAREKARKDTEELGGTLDTSDPLQATCCVLFLLVLQAQVHTREGRKGVQILYLHVQKSCICIPIPPGADPRGNHQVKPGRGLEVGTGGGRRSVHIVDWEGLGVQWARTVWGRAKEKGDSGIPHAVLSFMLSGISKGWSGGAGQHMLFLG